MYGLEIKLLPVECIGLILNNDDYVLETLCDYGMHFMQEGKLSSTANEDFEWVCQFAGRLEAFLIEIVDLLDTTNTLTGNLVCPSCFFIDLKLNKFRNN